MPSGVLYMSYRIAARLGASPNGQCFGRRGVGRGSLCEFTVPVPRGAQQWHEIVPLSYLLPPRWCFPGASNMGYCPGVIVGRSWCRLVVLALMRIPSEIDVRVVSTMSSAGERLQHLLSSS